MAGATLRFSAPLHRAERRLHEQPLVRLSRARSWVTTGEVCLSGSEDAGGDDAWTIGPAGWITSMVVAAIVAG